MLIWPCPCVRVRVYKELLSPHDSRSSWQLAAGRFAGFTLVSQCVLVLSLAKSLVF